MTNIDSNIANPALFDLTDDQIEAVSGGVIPLAAAGIYWGLGLGGFTAGFGIGQAIWGD